MIGYHYEAIWEQYSSSLGNCSKDYMLAATVGMMKRLENGNNMAMDQYLL